MMEQHLIYGAGGLAQELNAYFPNYFHGFIDDNRATESYEGLPVLSFDQIYPAFSFVCIAVGDPRRRQELAERLNQKGIASCPGLWSTESLYYGHTEIKVGPGSVIAPGCILTTHINIGIHTYINIGTTVGHRAQIGSYCNICPGVHISGDCIIEDGVFIGSGATIKEKVRIGAGARIAMGAAVIRDVLPGTLVAGVPAIIKVSR
jgi:sugar O-acyltransferase (sialic acid O-acetyltransferase NeuD family)